MDLREAYDTLEIDPGAAEDAVKDARKTLAKVWHPDRHANDPELQKKAQIKLAEVNAAFEAIRAAGYPSSIPKAKGTPEPTPKAAPKPEPKAEAKAPKPEPKPPKPEPKAPSIELVPRRRVRWSVILLLIAAVGVGAYFALVKLGSSSTKSKPDAAVIAKVDASVIDPPEAATDLGSNVRGSDGVGSDGTGSAGTNGADGVGIGTDGTSGTGTSGSGTSGTSGYTPPSTGKTFGLGSTHEDVLAAQGKPSKTQTVIDEEWSYGFSIVTFSKRGKVIAWWDRDDVLNLKLVPTDAAAAARAKAIGSYAIGATKDEVIGVQGTPNRISTVIDEKWYYGKESSLTFNGTGKLTGYHNSNNELSLSQ